MIGLSLKSKAIDEERAAVQEHAERESSQRPSESKKTGTLGDLIQAQLQGSKKSADS